MIQFRCWFCNRRYSVAENRIGERLVCTCDRRIRIPKRSGANCRDKTLLDWILEFAIYGSAGGFCGFVLGCLIVRVSRAVTWPFVLGLTLCGFVAGGLCGEAGLNWIGQKLRDHTD